jgi:tRNA threonylcarbamoyladenosine modification (KEOPS) complex  Pcc1 subunit
MSDTSFFSIQSTITFSFDNSQIRDISYTSFLPEHQKTRAKRSLITMQKKEPSSLEFSVKSQDITAFRASMNDIITFGKIIDKVLDLTALK